MAINPNRPVTPAAQPSSAEPARPAAPASTQAQQRVNIAPDGVVTQGVTKGDVPAILKFSTLPDQARYQQAVDKLQGRVQADLDLQDKKVPRDLYLRANYQSILLTQPTPSEKGTVIMLHGYTAGPWQFDEAAKKFHDAGYQVYAPRIPGHGMVTRDGMPSGAQMVAPGHEAEYEQFVDQVFDDAKALGGPVHVVGLSGGGGLGLRMAEQHPEIKGMVAMAPFVGPSEAARVTNNVLNGLARHTFLNLPAVLDLIPYNHNTRVSPDNPIPHTQGSLGNAQAMLSVGTKVNKITVPTQFLTTEGDLLSGAEPVAKLFQRSGGAKHDGWFHFNAAAKVPHAMASPKQFDGANAIWDRVFDAIDKGEFEQKPRQDPKKP